MRLRLEYYDQNETFAKVLPVVGSIVRKIRSKRKSEWMLFRLDAPVKYERFSYEYFLLRSRWLGREIGGKEPTSVFILLADEQKVEEGFDVQDFQHVGWGSTVVLQNSS